MTTDPESSRVTVKAEAAAVDMEIEVTILAGGRRIASGRGRPGAAVVVVLPDPRLWSPDDPFLYDLGVQLFVAGAATDTIHSSFGMRTISTGSDEAGHARILLNGKPVFQLGPLDQGYWPDGVLTPRIDEAAVYDLQYLKDIGCNMVRAHVKVQPDRWYHHCDRLGLLVWQDTVCYRDTEGEATSELQGHWGEEQRRMIDHLAGHPSIVMWTVFNEGWGQHDTERLTRWFRELDPTRLVSNASGWRDKECGEIYDVHNYSFHPAIPAAGEAGDRAVVIGEAGGFELLVPGHTWRGLEVHQAVDEAGDPWREVYEDALVFQARYRRWVEGLALLTAHGNSAVVYTQISDVEHEPNGWLTYDRAASKLPVPFLRETHAGLFAPPPELRSLTPAALCRIHTGEAPEAWEKPGFDDGLWTESPRGIGADLPAAIRLPSVRLPLHLRHRFTLQEVPRRPVVRFFGNGTAEIHVNGTLVKRIQNERSDYPAIADVILPETTAFRPGENLLAVRFTPQFQRDNVKPRDAATRVCGVAILEIADDHILRRDLVTEPADSRRPGGEG